MLDLSCKFCGQRCLVPLPTVAPIAMIEAYAATMSGMMATCPAGMADEKQRLGYCYENVRNLFDAPSPFRTRLEHLINEFSVESGSNTPDFLLAEYVDGCLRLWEQTTKARDRWYNVQLRPGNKRFLSDPDDSAHDGVRWQEHDENRSDL